MFNNYCSFCYRCSRNWGDRNFSSGRRFNNQPFRSFDNHSDSNNYGLKRGMAHFSGAHRLIKPDWDKLKLADIHKNCYQLHPAVSGRSKSEIDEWRNLREITIKGEGIPPPCLSFDECNFPRPIVETLKDQGFIRPTAIQSQGIKYLVIFYIN